MTQTSPEFLTLQAAADELGVHYMTAYRYVRIGALPATKDGKSWRVAVVDLKNFRDQTAASRSSDPAVWSKRYKDLATKGDETGAWKVITGALDTKLSPADVYTAVIGPALESIGSDWATGELDVADEHRASKLTSRILGQLSPRFRTRGAKRGTIVLGSVAGDEHELGGTMMADLMRSQGYSVDDLGSNVPMGSFTHACLGAIQLHGVAIGSYLKANDDRLAATIATIRAAVDIPIALGGPGVVNHDHAVALGAHGYASTVDEAFAIFSA